MIIVILMLEAPQRRHNRVQSEGGKDIYQRVSQHYAALKSHTTYSAFAGKRKYVNWSMCERGAPFGLPSTSPTMKTTLCIMTVGGFCSLRWFPGIIMICLPTKFAHIARKILNKSHPWPLCEPLHRFSTSQKNWYTHERLKWWKILGINWTMMRGHMGVG